MVQNACSSKSRRPLTRSIYVHPLHQHGTTNNSGDTSQDSVLGHHRSGSVVRLCGSGSGIGSSIGSSGGGGSGTRVGILGIGGGVGGLGNAGGGSRGRVVAELVGAGRDGDGDDDRFVLGLVALGGDDGGRAVGESAGRGAHGHGASHSVVRRGHVAGIGVCSKLKISTCLIQNLIRCVHTRQLESHHHRCPW